VSTVGFAFTAGTPARFKSSRCVERTFCGACGTALTYQDNSASESVDITACSLDHPEVFTPTREVWVAHRLPWVPVDATLMIYEKGVATDASAEAP
jgi:hypothetical protein